MVTQHSLTSRLWIMMLVRRYRIDSTISGITESFFLNWGERERAPSCGLTDALSR